MRQSFIALLLALQFPVATLQAQDVQETQQMGFEKLFVVIQRIIEENSTNPQQKESAEFLLEFFGNKEEQHKHVLFPLLYVSYSTDFNANNGYYIRAYEKEDYIPDKFDYSECYIRIVRISNNMMKVVIFIGDTDMGYDYIFKYWNNQWWLSTLVDISG
ncbi:MAG: hypothetical protein ACI3Y4_01480 [Candidatus Cryptobacteroides sp.]